MKRQGIIAYAAFAAPLALLPFSAEPTWAEAFGGSFKWWWWGTAGFSAIYLTCTYAALARGEQDWTADTTQRPVFVVMLFLLLSVAVNTYLAGDARSQSETSWAILKAWMTPEAITRCEGARSDAGTEFTFRTAKERHVTGPVLDPTTHEARFVLHTANATCLYDPLGRTATVYGR